MKNLYSLGKKLMFGGALALTTNAAVAQFELQLLHASDLEGGVEAIDRAPNFAALVDAMEDEYANTIILSAGDNYIPGPFFNAAGESSVFRDGGVFNDTYNTLFGTTDYNGLREGNGRVDISIMNIIGFDASCMGNHEFDAGPDVIQTIIEEDFRSPAGPAGDRWVGAQFPYLSANLDFSGDGSLSGLFTSDILFNTDFATGPAESLIGDGAIPKIAPATLIDVNGETIGVVGATTPILASISSSGNVAVIGSGTNDMVELAALLQPTIDAIIALGVDKIILVSHLQQIALEQELAGLLSGVDIIIAGGSDTVLANEDDDLLPEDQSNVGGSYPFETSNADGENCFIVSTNGEYSYVGRLIVNFDENGVVVSAGADSGPYLATESKVEEIWGNLVDPFAPGTKGSEVRTLVEAVTGIVIEKDGNIFGKTDVFLDGRRSQVRTEETNLGNLTADANLWFAKQIDETVQVSHKNGGGIRAAIGEIVDLGEGNYNFLPPQENPLSGKEEGEVSQLDIENSLRFNNGLTILSVTAAGLKEIIEHSVAASGDGATPGQFGQWGGLRFSFDPVLEPGSRVQNAVLIDEDGNPFEVLVRDGIVIGDPERPIRMVSLNFLVGGGDSYPFPELASDIIELSDEGGVPEEVVNEGVTEFANAGTEQDALAEYLAANFDDDPYDEEETPVEEDTRIQNLSVRSDAVIPDLTASFLEGSTWVSEDGSSVMVEVEVTNLTGGTVEVGVMASPASTAVEGVNYMMLGSAQELGEGVSVIVFEVMPIDDEAVGGTFLALELSANVVESDEDVHTVLIADNDRPEISAPLYPGLEMNVLSSLETPEGAVAEISAHDPASQRLFVTNSEDNQLLVFDFSNPMVSNIINTIEISEFGGGINSVAVANGIVAVAVEAEETGVRGNVLFLDTDGYFLNDVEAGFLPDMVTFTNDGMKVLTANEGEPNDDYDVDPEGSITIIDISGGVEAPIVTEATFTSFNDQMEELKAQGVRIFGPGATVAQDLEPEYVTVSADDATAFVTLQENNAVAVVDIASSTVVAILPLGYKDHSMVKNQLDISDRSDDIFMATWENVKGMYMPDAITSVVIDGVEYLITANEGDARDYDGYSEEERGDDLDLDPTAFPYADILQRDELLGRITVTITEGDTDGDGDYDELYAYGGRSFTIWNAETGEMVYDSGDELESIVKQDPLWGPFFNSTNDELELMNRSDNKGPEPEGVITGVINGKTYAFVILERMGGVVAYDISNPLQPEFVQYLNNRDPEDGEAGDLAPEGILFVKAEDSPTGGNLLVISNEVSGTITVISLDEQLQPTLPNCDNFAYFLSDVPQNGVSTIYGVDLDDVSQEANLTALKSVNYPVHIAYNDLDGLLYLVRSSNGSFRTLDVSIVDGALSEETQLSVNISGLVNAAFNADGKLVVGSDQANEVFLVDITDGTAYSFSTADVSGGDLEFDEDGNLYLATRSGGILYAVIPGMENMMLGNVPNLVTGMAFTSDGTLLLSSRDASALESRKLDGSVSASYNLFLDGETFTTFNGDMASGCADERDDLTVCVGFEVLEFNQGLQTNGSPVSADRSNPDNALGAPDKSNAPGGFVSLGDGGSITIGFPGLVLNGEGADINIFETSFSGDECGAGGNESAEVELSQDGVNWVSAGIICRDGEVDMEPLGLDFVSLIRITSVLGTSPDGYDVDGVEAVYGCDENPLDICEGDNGVCYATDAEYIVGITSNGGNISPARKDVNNALGAPEGTDQMVFTTLGYGGSLTFQFDGLVPNGDGDDIQVVETSFNNPGCEAYPEYADVSVSQDGNTFYFVGTVCKGDPFVDIADAIDSEGEPVALGCANYVRVANNDELTTTPDGYDVDGIVALHNCDEEGEGEEAIVELVNFESAIQLSSYPNPTAGVSQAVFVTDVTTRTTLEVYDMNGRTVAILFNQIANEGQEYRVEFDGAGLPNGVYVYRLTAGNETIIEKFMIAK